MMFTPCGPSAVPTGGAGVACPAGTCSFTTAAIGLAIGSVRFQLQVIKLDRRGPPEQRHRDPHLALVRYHFLDRAREVGERPFRDLHHLARQERNVLLGLFLFHGLFDPEEAVHLFRTERHRHPTGAHELDHALDAVDHVDRFLVQDHVHEHVARIDLALHRDLLAVLDLHLFLGGDQGLPDRLLLVRARVVLDAPVDERANLVLVPRRRLNRVQAMVRHLNRLATADTNTSCSSESMIPMSTPRKITNTTITPVAFLSSSQLGQVTFRTSAGTCTVTKSQARRSHPWRGGSRAAVVITSTPCAPSACCTAGSTSSTRPARGACAGS